MLRRGLYFPRKDYLEHIMARWFYAGGSRGKSWRKMMSGSKKKCALVSAPTRRQVIAGVAVAFGGLSLGSALSWAAAEEEISHTAESIHQEPVFKASRRRVYEALTDAKQFDKVVQLSGAVKTGMVKAPNPAEISREAGGAFALFGGYIF